MGVVYAFSFANSERSMTPMRFPLLFPLGGDGWTREMRSVGKKLTLRAWCAFVLQWRKGQDNTLMRAGGRLTHELAAHFRHSLLLQGNAHCTSNLVE